MKKGLVLEGGAMRGMFTAGVIDVMMENNIEFDGAIGVSAGAAFGCNYKSKQIGRVIRYNKRFAKEPKFCSMRSLLKTGDLYGAEFCWKTLPDQLDLFDYETYDSNPMDFYVVCTDMDTGEAVYHNCKKVEKEGFDWMRASASMPIVSRPVLIDGRRLSDGGSADSIPLRFFQSIGYDRNVVILTQPASYRKEPMKHAGLMRFFLRKYPVLLKRLEGRYLEYNACLDRIREEEKAGRIFVVRPEEALCIGSVCHDPEELERVYQIGRREGEKRVPEMLKFLEGAEAPDPDTERKREDEIVNLEEDSRAIPI